jgi:hypothetical protein
LEGDAASAALARLADIADQAGAGAIARDARQLLARVASGRFYVACIGQFKRGKSTLLNALLGAPVLPAGVLPITAVPTVIGYAARPAARVETGDGWHNVPVEGLADYVSEARNPENRLGVRAVDVGYPAEVLANGLCLVDTPGIGSVFEANTAATHGFIPHVDAALVVVGVDPPLSGDELALIEIVGRQVRDTIVVMNKADRFSDAERTEAAGFAERALGARLGRAVGPVLHVSATERLAGAAVARDWPALRRRLEELTATSGAALVRTAAHRGAERIRGALMAELRAQRADLLRPVAESERRLAQLRATLDDASQRALELSYLFTAEEQRLSRLFGGRREEFVRTATPPALADLRSAIATLPRRRGPAIRHAARSEAQRIGHAALDPWLASEHDEAEHKYVAVANRFIAIANEFLGRIAAADAEEFARLPRRFEFDSSLRAESRYYFHRLEPLLWGAGLDHALDWIRTEVRLRAALERQMVPYLRELIDVNSTRVATDLHERVVESRRRLEAQIQHVLGDVFVAAERGVVTARRLHGEGRRAVEAEVARLDRLRDELVAQC